MTTVVSLGERFVVNEVLPFSDPHGGGVHRRSLLVEVTELDGLLVSWSLVTVLCESGAPVTGARAEPQTGGFTISALDSLIEAGMMERLTR